MRVLLHGEEPSVRGIWVRVQGAAGRILHILVHYSTPKGNWGASIQFKKVILLLFLEPLYDVTLEPRGGAVGGGWMFQ